MQIFKYHRPKISYCMVLDERSRTCGSDFDINIYTHVFIECSKSCYAIFFFLNKTKKHSFSFKDCSRRQKKGLNLHRRRKMAKFYNFLVHVCLDRSKCSMQNTKMYRIKNILSFKTRATIHSWHNHWFWEVTENVVGFSSEKILDEHFWWKFHELEYTMSNIAYYMRV